MPLNPTRSNHNLNESTLHLRGKLDMLKGTGLLSSFRLYSSLQSFRLLALHTHALRNVSEEHHTSRPNTTSPDGGVSLIITTPPTIVPSRRRRQEI